VCTRLLSSMAQRLVLERYDHRFVAHSRLRSGFRVRGPTQKALSGPVNDRHPATRAQGQGKVIAGKHEPRTRASFKPMHV
jgi:hypothetical protein